MAQGTVKSLVSSLNSNISSETGGVPVRSAGVISAGGNITIPISSNFSGNEGFALVSLNISGNALVGCELLFLGKGSGKKKALIGAMADTMYSLSYAYNNRGEWTITNNASDPMYYTALISK